MTQVLSKLVTEMIGSRMEKMPVKDRIAIRYFNASRCRRRIAFTRHEAASMMKTHMHAFMQS